MHAQTQPGRISHRNISGDIVHGSDSIHGSDIFGVMYSVYSNAAAAAAAELC